MNILLNYGYISEINQSGKVAVFKTVVKGDPTPEVTWRRLKGTPLDNDRFKTKYDASSGEWTLEVSKCRRCALLYIS